MSDSRSTTQRRQEARRIAAEVLDRRSAGQLLPDASVLESHRDLVPELSEELEFVGQIRLGLIAGGKVKATSPLGPVLSWDALEQPIEDDEGDENLADHPVSKPQIAGYAIQDQIGRGGQGTVYRAIQESTDRPVAIKVMAAKAGSRYRARIEREAKLLASLRHPHIVSVIERSQTSGGLFCVVMELVDGPELDDYWSKQVPPGEAGAEPLLRVFLKLARAMGEAHARGIVHRDLKPSNVRVDPQGEPRILDFGLARAVTGGTARAVTTTGQIVGSLPWASPEQAAAGATEIKPSGDVYSLGVMLYQGLTGRFPYAVDGPLLELLTHIAKTVPPAPRHVPGARRTSPALDRVVLRALAKRPEDRHPDGRALAEDLESALNGGFTHSERGERLRQVAVIAIAASLCTWGIATSPPEPPRRAAAVQKIIELPVLRNSVGMSLVRVPAGPFVMGSATGEGGQSGGIDQRLVTISSAFYLGTIEVTQQQYEAVMKQNPSDRRWLGPQMPVQCVTWNEANEFCRRLSQAEGRHYRLPTSAEWEYACRAGSTTPFGDSGSLDAVGWYAGNSGGAIHTAGGKQPNVWGFYDVHGNVAEWCSDVPAPTPPQSLAIIRGGSALRSAMDCRSAAYSLASVNGRFNDVGFRVALDP